LTIDWQFAVIASSKSPFLRAANQPPVDSPRCVASMPTFFHWSINHVPAIV
jgi:hypothetical protein